MKTDCDKLYKVEIVINEPMPEDFVIAINLVFAVLSEWLHEEYPEITPNGLVGEVTYGHAFGPVDLPIILHYYDHFNKYRIDDGEWKESMGNHYDLGDSDWYWFRKQMHALLHGVDL